MENFLYFTPTKIYFGEGEEDKLSSILKEYNIKKVMLHYGMSSIKKMGLYDKVIQNLKDGNIEFVELGGVKANPELELVNKGIELARKEKVDLILAVGGGSVIDSAKAIGDGAYDCYNVWDYFMHKDTPKKHIPVGVILTIAAAGSEMSQSCVITNEKTKEKRGFNSVTHRPLFAILNPKLTYSVDKFQTGCGIVDIMMHTLERYYSINDDTTLTDNLSLGLLKSVKEAGETAIKDPCNYNARATLMWASSLSHNDLMGCGKNYVMPVHQLEHEVSGMFPNIAHGAGLSVLFPAWAEYVYKSDVARFKTFATFVMQVEEKESDEETALEGIKALKKYFKELGMPTSLKELGIDESNFESLAYNFTFKGKREINDRVKIGYKEALDIFNLAK